MVTCIPAGNLKIMVTDRYIVSKGNVRPYTLNLFNRIKERTRHVCHYRRNGPAWPIGH